MFCSGLLTLVSAMLLFFFLFFFFLFFFNDTATTEIYTLSLHDALPIYDELGAFGILPGPERHPLPIHRETAGGDDQVALGDRKSTRLNSSHTVISYAVFCLKKKKKKPTQHQTYIHCEH